MVAGDVGRERLVRLRENLRRAGVAIRVLCADLLSAPFPNQFVFPGGQACRNFDQLATACQQGWQSAVVASIETKKNKALEGKSVTEIAKISNKKPTDVVFDLLKEEGGSVPTVYFLMSEDDVRTALQIP